jgi:hypothetical protein
MESTSTFSPEVLEAADREREVELITSGRKTGKEHRVTIWIWGDGHRLFIRSGGGMGRDWPQNLMASGRGLLRIGEQVVSFRARHLDPTEARTLHPLVSRKYGIRVRGSAQGEPPTPAEEATFEILPA